MAGEMMTEYREPIFALLDSYIAAGYGNVPRPLIERLIKNNGCLPDKNPYPEYQQDFTEGTRERMRAAAIKRGCRVDYQTIVGETFGRLTVLSVDDSNRRRIEVHCECECGQPKTVEYHTLARGHTKSCGCWRRDIRYGVAL